MSHSHQDEPPPTTCGPVVLILGTMGPTEGSQPNISEWELTKTKILQVVREMSVTKCIVCGSLFDQTFLTMLNDTLNVEIIETKKLSSDMKKETSCLILPPLGPYNISMGITGNALCQIDDVSTCYESLKHVGAVDILIVGSIMEHAIQFARQGRTLVVYPGTPYVEPHTLDSEAVSHPDPPNDVSDVQSSLKRITVGSEPTWTLIHPLAARRASEIYAYTQSRDGELRIQKGEVEHTG
eukprot:GHVH01002102.1.p1 GENE.GHVH01002102.1~~GHVH01002102.1.p1  ORF type:complete len:239 (+),score=29.00 GHVH01002102.1:345-1061(+)